MRGDFSQLLEPDGSVACVLHQQGEVLRDIDLNEQSLQFWYRLKTLMNDIQGTIRDMKDAAFPDNYKGPFRPEYVGGASLQIPKVIYVEGIRVEFDRDVHTSQIQLTLADLNVLNGGASDKALTDGQYS